jgi:CRP/FNR family transcriptional regulator
MAELAGRAAGAAVLKAKAGDVLFRPDDECRGFIALRSGALRVGLTSPAGRELVLYRVKPGEICLQTFSCLAENRSYAAEGVAETGIDAVLLPPRGF